MSYDPRKHQRRSIRLPEYDYTRTGEYFVTIVTRQREATLGKIRDGSVLLSPLGEIAREEWFRTAALRANVRLEAAEFVVMPNHVHGIVWIVGDDNTDRHEWARVGAQRRCAPTVVVSTHNPIHPNAPPNVPPPEIQRPGEFVGRDRAGLQIGGDLPDQRPERIAAARRSGRGIITSISSAPRPNGIGLPHTSKPTRSAGSRTSWAQAKGAASLRRDQKKS